MRRLKILNRYRMWAYALIATGFINWDYQRDAPGAALKSLLIIIPGGILLASTFNSALAAKLENKRVKYFWGAVGLIALIYAFIN